MAVFFCLEKCMIDLFAHCVSRVFILPVPLFDYFKRYQRSLAARTGQKHDNSQALAMLMQEHQQHIGFLGKPSERPTAALLAASEGVKQ